MALINVTAKISGSSDTAAQSGLRMSVAAALLGASASGLGRQPEPAQPAEQKKP